MKQLKIENIGHEDLAIRKILLIFVADFLLFIMSKLYRHYKGRIVTETSEACALRLAREVIKEFTRAGKRRNLLVLNLTKE